MWQNEEFVSTICSHCLSSLMFTVIYGIYPIRLHAFVNFLVRCANSIFSFVTQKVTCVRMNTKCTKCEMCE